MGDILCRAGQPGNDQKILRIPNQFRHHLTAVEHPRLTGASRASSTEDITWHEVLSSSKTSLSSTGRRRLKKPWHQSNAATARRRRLVPPDRPWYRRPGALARLLQ